MNYFCASLCVNLDVDCLYFTWIVLVNLRFANYIAREVSALSRAK